MSNKIKLLPCPFCGGEAGILKNGTGCYQVYCDNCETRQYAYAHKTKESAIESWNTRKPMDRIVEQLKELRKITGVNTIGSYCQTTLNKAIEIVKGGGKV